MYILTDVVKNYTRRHRAVAALRGVDLVIRDGEWLAIQGPTGHGKSTLLQIIGGLDRPTSGSVEFGGLHLSRIREAAVTRIRARSIGFVFQTFNLIPTLSAAENVAMALVPLHAGAAARRSRAEQALAAVGLAGGFATCRRSWPAASSSGWPSPGRWSRNRPCCWPTSRPATWTRTPGTRSSPCWRTCGASAG